MPSPCITSAGTAVFLGTSSLPLRAPTKELHQHDLVRVPKTCPSRRRSGGASHESESTFSRSLGVSPDNGLARWPDGLASRSKKPDGRRRGDAGKGPRLLFAFRLLATGVRGGGRGLLAYHFFFRHPQSSTLTTRTISPNFCKAFEFFRRPDVNIPGEVGPLREPHSKVSI